LSFNSPKLFFGHHNPNPNPNPNLNPNPNPKIIWVINGQAPI